MRRLHIHSTCTAKVTQANLAYDNEARKRSFLTAGALPQLLALLQHESADVIELAARVLTHLAKDSESVATSLASGGAVPPLAALLRRPRGGEVTEQAAAALAHLAERSEPARRAIEAESDAVPDLVRLLRPTQVRAAFGATATIASC